MELINLSLMFTCLYRGDEPQLTGIPSARKSLPLRHIHVFVTLFLVIPPEYLGAVDQQLLSNAPVSSRQQKRLMDLRHSCGTTSFTKIWAILSNAATKSQQQFESI